MSVTVTVKNDTKHTLQISAVGDTEEHNIKPGAVRSIEAENHGKLEISIYVDPSFRLDEGTLG